MQPEAWEADADQLAEPLAGPKCMFFLSLAMGGEA